MAKYELYKDRAGEFRFRLKAPNGEIILSSEGYYQIGSCRRGIEAVKGNCSDDRRYRRLMSANAGHYFTLTSANNQVIARSQIYGSTYAVEKGIEAVKKHGENAQVMELLE